MIVISPDDSDHSIRIIPRVYNSNANTLSLYNEDTRTTSDIVNVKAISGGFATYDFTLTVIEGEQYSIKITEGNTVVWRGKMFVTNQTTQEYKING